MNEDARREQIVDVFINGKLELLALTEMNMKGNGRSLVVEQVVFVYEYKVMKGLG